MTKSLNRLAAGVALGLTLAAPAMAQSVDQCDWASSAFNLVEPWEANSRTFSNGKTRLALLDTIEPGAAAFRLLILSPPYDEVGGRQCRVVSLGQGMGFGGMDFGGLHASYDPATGLQFEVRVQLYNPETSLMDPANLLIVLNQATGEIFTDLQPGIE